MIGPIVTEADVRGAMTAHLQLWSPTYLAEIGRQAGRAGADLPPFRSYTTAVEEIDALMGDQLPICVVVAPGAAGPPTKHGHRWAVRWAVGVGVVVSARTRDETSDLVGLYTAAVRGAVLQHPSLGGFASGVTWEDERYDELASDGERTIQAGRVIFGVDVEAAIDIQLGPAAPTVDPHDPLPVVQDVIVEFGDEP